MYLIKQSKQFKKSVLKLIQQQRLKLEDLNLVIIKLSQDPFYKGLRTHKVNTKKLGLKYSSRVDGDLRIIWSFDSNKNLIIHLLDIGGHSGNRSVY